MKPYDPFDNDVQDNPYPYYDIMRGEGPAFRNDERNFWALHRFTDVWDAVHDSATYSSAKGVFVPRDEADGVEKQKAFPPTLIMMDPPRHTQLRKLVSRAFTARRIAALEDRIHALASELIAPARDSDSFDLVETVAGPLPTYVIADLLGVPREDYAQFRVWSEHMVGATSDGEDPAVVRASAGAALGAYFSQIVADRRKTPREDLITALTQAEVDGERLSHEELLGFCLLLLVAGNETTVNLISNSMLALSTRPDQQKIVREGMPSQAIEEFLRFDSPVQGLSRTLTRDVSIGGKTMREGDSLLLLYGAANRDPDEFGPTADRLDINRDSRRHLAFGHGPHFCLGASLARLEARLACEEILGAFSWIELAGEPERLRSGPMRGLRHLPLRNAAKHALASNT